LLFGHGSEQNSCHTCRFRAATTIGGGRAGWEKREASGASRAFEDLRSIGDGPEPSRLRRERSALDELFSYARPFSRGADRVIPKRSGLTSDAIVARELHEAIGWTGTAGQVSVRRGRRREPT